jgi:hypothetical protein
MMGRPKQASELNKLEYIKIRIPTVLKNMFQVRSAKDGGMSKVIINYIKKYIESNNDQ